MRSLVTIILGLIASIVVFALIRQSDGDSIRSWFSKEAMPKGTRINSFEPLRLTKVVLTRGDGESIVLEVAEIGWITKTAPADRVDAALLSRLVKFSRDSAVIDSLPAKEVTDADFGFGAESMRIQLYEGSDKLVSDYIIGSKTPWKLTIKDSEDLMGTVYIKSLAEDQSDFVYVSSDPIGDIHDIFENRFKKLRDHKPLFFNPDALKIIKIKTAEGEITLSRPSIRSAWAITKPLTLRTDPEAVKSLISGLLSLTATEINSASAVTPTETAAKPYEISIQSFGVKGESTLKVNPPAPGATTTQGSTNDREVIFTLPLATQGKQRGVSSLPLTLNSLRYKYLTSVHLPAIQTISISGPGVEPTLLTRPNPRQAWMVDSHKGFLNTDLLAINDLFTTLLKTPVAAFTFASETTDLSIYGLDKPLIQVTLGSFDKKGLAIKFGKSPTGKYYAQRLGEPHVYEISDEAYAKIPKTQLKWRERRLWDFSRVNLKQIETQRRGQPSLKLDYNFHTQRWKAALDGENVFARLKISTAAKFVEKLETLDVLRWLKADNAIALEALKRPVFRIKIGVSNPQTRELEFKTLTIAKATESSANRFFYGVMTDEEALFMLDYDTVKKLATPLLEKE